jgi:diguanylate cyclase (GGDEF)-like protein/PAS domain S-box-containing protein
MSYKIISKKLIIIVPIVFVLVSIVRIYLNYTQNQEAMRYFISEQSRLIDSLYMAHRNYYQNLYLKKILKLDEKTVVGLPAFSASKISKDFSNQNRLKIQMQTVSDRARNPKNQADEFELRAIEYFKKNRDAKEYFKKEKDFYQYATPLKIEKKCLKCHGKKEDAPLFISKRYDKAYDYKMGDIRGILSVKVPTEHIVSVFNRQFFSSVIYDTFLVIIIILVSLYLIRFFSKLQKNLENELYKRTKELQDSLSFLQSYKDAIDANLIVSKADIEGNITYANPNFCKITGYEYDELIGKNHNILRAASTPIKIYDELWDTISSKKIWHGILKNVKKDGTSYWVDSTITPILDADGKIYEYISIRVDITQFVEQRDELLYLATTDPLTALKNRNALIENIYKYDDVSLILINIDSFSQINDFYGHEIGDEILQEFAIRLSNLCEEDVDLEIFRLNGDEFAVLCIDVSSHLVIAKAQEIVKLTDGKFKIQYESIELNITASVSFEENNSLLSTADMALKIARKDKKDLIVYDKSMSLDKEYENNMFWSKKIKEAIADDRVEVFYQPIVDNRNEEIHRYEALIRLRDENDKIISPYFFLEIAKKAKLYKQLTKIVILKTFEMFRENDFEFSINLSIDDILDKDINEYIFDMLDMYNISDRVIFEIVESESIENFEEIQKFIKNVKAMGCRIAIDDFGTGYSNFEYLMRLEPDFIKIDGSITKGILEDKNSQIITSIMVEFAKKIDIKVIAEYVENKEIFEKIKELGVDKSQGYYFSEPKGYL